MKTLSLSVVTVLLLCTFSTKQVSAANKVTPSTHNAIESTEIKALLNRLDEIKAMDVSTMTRAEKKELRKEVQSTKEALRSNGYSGFYISGGAIIIIVLLIILL